MAVTSPPRPPRASTSGPPAPSGPLRVHWDRVAIFAAIVVLIIILVVVVIMRGFAGSSRKIEAAPTTDPVPQPTQAVSSAAPSVAPPPCPTPATRPIYAAPAVAGGDRTARTVALTFDDGPSEFTPQVLEILRQKQVRATFFVLGKEVVQRPEELKAIVDAGHMVANHTWSHNMPKPSVGWKTGTLAREIARTRRAIVESTGQEACLFRPPGGVLKGTRAASRDALVSIVMWSVDTRDWAGQRAGNRGFADTIRKRAQRGLKEAHPVVLMHDGGGFRGSTVAALPRIIDDYRAAGYQFVDLAGRI
jgi:peptidoglycan/xylan/chitin deacetylase (PgdA/CDA1 family)